MASISATLSTELRDALGLQRAVETGTYLGDGTRALASVFPRVATIELSAELHESVAPELISLGVTPLLGSSVDRLPELVDPSIPTLYFLDGHWSGGFTAGSGDECPILEEISIISSGHQDDCIIIDDARLFAAAPPPPHDAAQWPTLTQVFDAIRRTRPNSHVTLLHDQIIAVPSRAKTVIDRYGQRLATHVPSRGGVIERLKRMRLRRRRARVAD